MEVLDKGLQLLPHRVAETEPLDRGLIHEAVPDVVHRGAVAEGRRERTRRPTAGIPNRRRARRAERRECPARWLAEDLVLEPGVPRNARLGNRAPTVRHFLIVLGEHAGIRGVRPRISELQTAARTHRDTS